MGYLEKKLLRTGQLYNFYFFHPDAQYHNQVFLFNKTFPKFVGNKPKGQISKRVFQENKAHQIFRKTNISYPLIRSFSLCFLGTPVLRFALFPYYRRIASNRISASWHLVEWSHSLKLWFEVKRSGRKAASSFTFPVTFSDTTVNCCQDFSPEFSIKVSFG